MRDGEGRCDHSRARAVHALLSSDPRVSLPPFPLRVAVPRITEKYITTRLEAVAAVAAAGGLEDPLEMEEQLSEQLESLPALCRFQYEHTCGYLCTLLDPLLGRYGVYGDPSGVGPGPSLAVVEGQLTWLVYVVGAVIRGRLASAAAESQEGLDGELALRVFQLLRLMQRPGHAGRAAEPRQRLELAVLGFFQNFRKVYVGEQAMHTSRVYLPLAERLGLTDHLAVLNACVSKIWENLDGFAACPPVVEASLALLSDLAAGYMSGKLLLKLDAVSFALSHHTETRFPFLREPANARSRTLFYATLGRLLFCEDAPARFKAFIAPFDALCCSLAAAAAAPDGGLAFRSPQSRVRSRRGARLPPLSCARPLPPSPPFSGTGGWPVPRPARAGERHGHAAQLRRVVRLAAPGAHAATARLHVRVWRRPGRGGAAAEAGLRAGAQQDDALHVGQLQRQARAAAGARGRGRVRALRDVVHAPPRHPPPPPPSPLPAASCCSASSAAWCAPTPAGCWCSLGAPNRTSASTRAWPPRCSCCPAPWPAATSTSASLSSTETRRSRARRAVGRGGAGRVVLDACCSRALHSPLLQTRRAGLRLRDGRLRAARRRAGLPQAGACVLRVPGGAGSQPGAAAVARGKRDAASTLTPHPPAPAPCHQVRTIVCTDDATFGHIAACLEAGLKSLDVGISSQCASAVDALAGFYFAHLPIRCGRARARRGRRAAGPARAAASTG